MTVEHKARVLPQVPDIATHNLDVTAMRLALYRWGSLDDTGLEPLMLRRRCSMQTR